MKKNMFVGLECISLDQMLENMSDLQGHKVVVESDRVTANIYNMCVYGELPEAWDWAQDGEGDELWEGCDLYEELKAAWEKVYINQ